MPLEKQDTSRLNPLSLPNVVRLQLGRTQGEGLSLGRAVELLKGKQATSLSGDPTTPMPKSVGVKDMSMSTALLCRNILGDHLKATSLSITRTGLKTITELRTLSYLLRMFTGGKLYALTVRRSLQYDETNKVSCVGRAFYVRWWGTFREWNIENYT